MPWSLYELQNYVLKLVCMVFFNVSGQADMFGTEFLLHWSTDMTFATAYIEAGSRSVNVSATGLTTPLTIPAFDVETVVFYNHSVDSEVWHFI